MTIINSSNNTSDSFLQQQNQLDLLRFITCGSVDDGKSTLIGRLLYEAKCIFDDQVSSLQKESIAYGTQGGDIDYALLVDGLAAEREQGITIDVAYRFFNTDKRKFIVADTPGHEQYTRNMVTGASTTDLAVILIDARKGVLEQTRRHAFICSLLGIKHVMLAINKMDLVNYQQSTFETIEQDFADFAKQLNFNKLTAIPVSALKGDNVVERSSKMVWFKGPTLLAFLETVPTSKGLEQHSFRMPVQWVNRPHLDFRGFSGTVAAGSIKPGDDIRILPSGSIAKVKDIASSYSKVMVIFDSNHTHEHVLKELEAYALLASVESYCVVFDTLIEDMPSDMFPDRPWGVGNNPKTAVWEFLKNHDNFEIDKNIQNKLLITVAPDGFLKRTK